MKTRILSSTCIALMLVVGLIAESSAADGVEYGRYSTIYPLFQNQPPTMIFQLSKGGPVKTPFTANVTDRGGATAADIQAKSDNSVEANGKYLTVNVAASKTSTKDLELQISDMKLYAIEAPSLGTANISGFTWGSSKKTKWKNIIAAYLEAGEVKFKDKTGASTSVQITVADLAGGSMSGTKSSQVAASGTKLIFSVVRGELELKRTMSAKRVVQLPLNIPALHPGEVTINIKDGGPSWQASLTDGGRVSYSGKMTFEQMSKSDTFGFDKNGGYILIERPATGGADGGYASVTEYQYYRFEPIANSDGAYRMMQQTYSLRLKTE